MFDVDPDGRPVLRVHVQPGAGLSEVVGRHGDALKVRVAAAPHGGRANEACVRLLAELFEVQTAAVGLVGGATSRSKRFVLEGIESAQVAEQLERVLSVERRPVPEHRLDRRPTGR
ncbi:MAG: DUF167 domain-containing protein [Actinobacteria bacterium]|nr:DUF167 domain-containing protein [Actinomycetota bacterium]MBW3643075.1 DUF167 domain-containing protein [Actinomycetota bacterium]